MYLFDFIKRSYGIISFGDVMLGDAIDDASKKLTPFYDALITHDPRSNTIRKL